MKTTSIILPIFCYLTCLQGFSQNELQKRISTQTIQLAQKIAGNSKEGIYSYHIETPQIAKWKNGYVLSYVDIKRKSWLLFLDQDFKKKGSEIEIKNRIILQVVTDNNELAILSTKPTFLDQLKKNNSYKELYFSKLNENGTLQLDVFIGGGNSIEKPLQTEVDNMGNYRMIWDKNSYLVDFAIQHNFSKTSAPDIHQGDAFIRITPEGNLTIISDWNTSHSFQQFILSGEEYYITLTKGDVRRGLNAQFFSRKGELEEYEDGIFPHIKYEFSNDSYFACNPYPVAGGHGENYVPYTIGDGVMLDKDAVLVGFSTSNNRKSYDVGLIQVFPSKEASFSQITWLTDTPKRYEHSLRMHRISPNQIAIFWKSFSMEEANRTIEKLENEFEDEPNSEEIILEKVNFDEQWMALIDNQGKWVKEPEKIQSHTYYCADGFEAATEWNYFINDDFDHTYSPMIIGHKGELLWLNHNLNSSTLIINRFN
jgi:hypothetical protein